MQFTFPFPVRARAVAVACLLSTVSQLGLTATESFDPNFNGIVHAVLVEIDGSLVMGGAFTALHPNGLGAVQSRSGLARFLGDGSLDVDFTPEFDGAVRTLAKDRLGRLLVGGGFEQVQVGTLTFTRHGLVRFNVDGSVDTTFSPQFEGEDRWRDAVQALAVLADGSVVVGGTFKTVRSSSAGEALAQSYAVRLDATGKIVPAFAPGLNNEVLAVTPLREGGFIIGGAFTQAGGVSAQRLARYTADGERDAAWTVGADNLVRALAVDVDGSLFIGGDFLKLRGVGETDLLQQIYLARVSSSGVRDLSFHPRPNARVNALAIEHSGAILVGGEFSYFLPFTSQSTWSAAHLARVSRYGSLDTSFRPGPSGPVKSIALQEDGGIVIGGQFTNLTDVVTGSSITRYFGARVHENGRVDSVFNTSSGATVYAAAERWDGAIYVGGAFTEFSGESRTYLALIDAAGVVEAGFAPELNGAVQTMVLQPDGKLVIGGSFTHVNDELQPYLARLNSDGSLDTGFDPQPNSSVYDLVRNDDGSLIVGGSFTGFSPGYDADTSPDDYAGISRAYLGRIKVDGTIDETWTPSPDGAVIALLRQSDGKLVMAGNFSAVGAEARNYLARLNADGSVDKGFNPSPNGSVYALGETDDGSIVIGGEFSLLQLDDGEGDDDDGDEFINDDASRGRLARILADGSLDRVFTPVVNAAVSSLLVLADGDVLVGGSFTRYAATADAEDEAAANLIRLNADGTRDGGIDWQTNGMVAGIWPLRDGSQLLGGAFSTVFSSDGGSVRLTTPLMRYEAEAEAGVDEQWAARASVNENRYVGAMAIQRSGHVLVGGQFEEIAGAEHHNVARFNADGRIDAYFGLRANGPVDALLDRIPDGIWDTLRSPVAWLGSDGQDLPGASYAQLSQLSGTIQASALEADGSILLGGYFTHTEGTAGSNLVRLREDGTFDPNFRPNPSLSVMDLAVQADGRIVVVGAFTEIAGTAQSYAARLWPDGSIDAKFTPKPQSSVSTVALQSDGKVLMGGSFTTFGEDDGEGDDDDLDLATDDDTRQAYLARLQADGLLDREFVPVLNASVGAILVHADGEITIGGQFTTVTHGDTSYARNYLARLSSSGALVEAFDPAPNGAVYDLARQEDGKLLIAGSFTLFYNLTDNEDDDDDGDGDTDDDGKEISDEDADVYYLARLNADDTLDTSYDPRPNSTVWEIELDSSGSVLVNGDFGALFPHDAEYGIRRNGLARVLVDGTVDSTFNPNPDDVVYTMLGLPDGRVLLGGMFQTLQTEPVLYLGGAFTALDDLDLPYFSRIQPDGNPDGSYRPEPNGAVRALSALPDGRFLVAGEFTRFFGQARSRLVRLTGNGLLDTEFAPDFDGTVRALAMDHEGALVVGGDFSLANGVAREGVARLWSDGSLDSTWAPIVNGRVDAIASYLDGGVLVAGAFTQVNQTGQAYLARLDQSGIPVPTFSPQFDGGVHSVVVRGDGRIVAGGAFRHVNGLASPGLVVLERDGSVFLTNSVDTNGRVLALDVDREGRLMAGGTFTRFDGVSRALLARTSGAGSFGQALLVDDSGSGLTWVQTGAAAAAAAVQIAVSTDGENWVERGTASRVLGTEVWRWQGAPLPVDEEYLVRLRVFTASNRQGSSSVREYYRNFVGTLGSGYGYASTLPGRTDLIGGDLGDWLPGGAGIVITGGGVVSGGSGSGPVENGGVDPWGSRLRNLSTRVVLAGEDTLTVGFVVEGGGPRRLLLRAIGPGLEPYLGGGEMKSPKLVLRDSSSQELAVNTGWQSTAQMRDWFNQSGAFSLTAGSADAVLAPVLMPGAYTLSINDVARQGGVVLTEVYDLGALDAPDRLVNLSALSHTGEDDETLVVGFVIEGQERKRMLIRGVGPTLLDFGVEDAMTDVALRVHLASGALVAANENWADLPAEATAVAAGAQQVGAFAFAPGSLDAAVLVDLAPGVYTVQLLPRGEGGARGLVEIYEVQP